MVGSIENRSGLRFRLRGEVDMETAPDLHEKFDVLVSASGDDIVLDCADLEFIDSSGIKELVNLRHALDRQGRSMRIVNMGRTSQRVIEVCGLAEFLGLEPDD